MPSPTEISVSQLSRLIGTPEAPVIIDTRIDEDFNADPQLLPTARRCSHAEIASLENKLKEKNVVIYCQKGKKISQGAGAVLRTLNIKTETLMGGHFAWRDADLPLVPESSLPKANKQGRTVWVTKHRPKIDRIACPWLVKRFIDPNAQFLFVSPSEVHAVAEKFDAMAFDIEEAKWSHEGDQCTFDAMLRGFSLETKPLLHMATIVRGADTDRHELAPESAGLLALSLGLSRMYRNDIEQLNAGMMFYDALYRWTRDAVNETHDWPTTPKGK